VPFVADDVAATNTDASTTAAAASTTTTSMNNDNIRNVTAQLIVSTYNHINMYGECMTKDFGKPRKDDTASLKKFFQKRNNVQKNMNVLLYSSTAVREQLLATDNKQIPNHTINNI